MRHDVCSVAEASAFGKHLLSLLQTRIPDDGSKKLL
jgi:hypothetical protein